MSIAFVQVDLSTMLCVLLFDSANDAHTEQMVQNRCVLFLSAKT
jgi:hypothetical protein